MVWLSVTVGCCACVGWILRQWWRSKSSAFSIKKIAFILGALVILLLLMAISADVWATAGLATCHLLRKDIRQISYYTEVLHDASIPSDPYY